MPANELADQRDQMVLRLSQLTAATSRQREDGAIDVYIGGSALVSGTNFREVETGGARRYEDQAALPATLTWKDNDSEVLIQNGKGASVLQTLSTTMPKLVENLDLIASTLINTINDQHIQGYDLNGSQGVNFFSGSTAADINVAITDPALIAASGSDTSRLDASNADKLAQLVGLLDGPDEVYRGIVVQYGVDAQAIGRRADIQAAMKQDIDSIHSSQSGVNLDEEMASLLSYQRAYEAASRVISVVDSTLDTLINRMGR
jgi:flagellar hook-associated protein 1 FlgK